MNPKTERQKYRKIEPQKDRNAERQKHRKIEKMKDRQNGRQKDNYSNILLTRRDEMRMRKRTM